MSTDGTDIFQVSDLANSRVEFLNAARSGEARLRDRDGTSLVMLPERRLRFLEIVADWSADHLRLKRLLERDDLPTIADLGKLAWLRVFDRHDLGEFENDLQDALIAATADGSSEPIDETVREWRITARELKDPLRRNVLLSSHVSSDFVDADEPVGN
jgi:hypothetical protein